LKKPSKNLLEVNVVAEEEEEEGVAEEVKEVAEDAVASLDQEGKTTTTRKEELKQEHLETKMTTNLDLVDLDLVDLVETTRKLTGVHDVVDLEAEGVDLGVVVVDVNLTEGVEVTEAE